MLTSKAQTTVSKTVRLALGAVAGDEIAYAILDLRVPLTKTPPPAPRRDAPFEDL